MSISKTTKGANTFLLSLSFLSKTIISGGINVKYTENGTLTVRTYTASGALPVKNSLIRITGVDENNRYVDFTLLTDEDGVTRIISLPTPDKAFSTGSGATEIPYAVYDIEASADGYYTKRISNVAIFSGVNSSQAINMIPISIGANGDEYPRGNLNATVYENEYL